MDCSILLVALLCSLTAFRSVLADNAGPVYVQATNTRQTPEPSRPPLHTNGDDGLLTQTVYGFLDFTTKIGNTIVIFSPQSSAEPVASPSESIEPTTTQPPPPPKSITTSSTSKIIAISSIVEVVSEPPPSSTSTILPSKVEIVAATSSVLPPPEANAIERDESPPQAVALIEDSPYNQPEYEFMSRQPSEIVEETYKLVNLKSKTKVLLRPRATSDSKKESAAHPTGLVTKLGGTVVKDGTTTVHETSVIGTYISGKYAQVLQSVSHIYQKPADSNAKIQPSPTLRILKTATPSLKSNKHRPPPLEPTPAASLQEETVLPVESLFDSQSSVKFTRKPPPTSGSSSSAIKSRLKAQKHKSLEDTNEAQPNKKRFRSFSKDSKSSESTKPEKSYRKPTPASSSTSATEIVATSTKRFTSKRAKSNRPIAPSEVNPTIASTRKRFKPKIVPSHIDQHISTSTTLYKFKLNRSPGRWQYKTSPKPRVSIRKQHDATEDIALEESAAPLSIHDPALVPNDLSEPPQPRSDIIEGSEPTSISLIEQKIESSSTSINSEPNPFPVETLKVEISTPPDFADIYYEIATIKSPYSFQVGSVKNTRYITVTSTFEKTFESSTIEPTSFKQTPTEPLTENILASSTRYKDHLHASEISTLPPMYLSLGIETPALETVTESYNTTQTMLKTHLLPVIHQDSNQTQTSTLIQTYVITRLITATKTMPPNGFDPSKTLNEFNSHLDEAGSELHVELESGDHNDADKLSLRNLEQLDGGVDLDDLEQRMNHLRPKKASSSASKAPIALNSFNEPTPNLQQLALLRLFNPQPQLLTTSRPIIRVETVYESHVVPLIQGTNTIFSTISKILGAVTKTDYEFGTSTMLPTIPNGLPLPPPINPLFAAPPPPQPQFSVTSSPIVHSTLVTKTDSKVLKLTFGAKTAYTTISSTTVVPTITTTYVTVSIPVQPTAHYPGYFPAPYGAYPFVG